MQASKTVGMDQTLVTVKRAKLRDASAEHRALRWTLEDRVDTFTDVQNRVSTSSANIENGRHCVIRTMR
jgi:hypothetical protein